MLENRSMRTGGLRVVWQIVGCGLHQGFNLAIARLHKLQCLRFGNRCEAHPIAGAHLAEHPLIRYHHGDGADKAAEARSIGSENDRHIAGEIHGADGISVVMDV